MTSTCILTNYSLAAIEYTILRKEYNLKPPGLNASRNANSRPESLDNEKVRKKRIE